jgi:hypothetical protein
VDEVPVVAADVERVRDADHERAGRVATACSPASFVLP